MIYVYDSVIEQIRLTIGVSEPERGGILGAKSFDLPISAYYFDITSQHQKDRYVPDCNKINEVLEHQWLPRDLYMYGIVHSHDASCPFPSCGDIEYAHRIINALSYTNTLFLPIVLTDNFSIIPYTIKVTGKNIRTEKNEMKIIKKDMNPKK